MFNSFSGHLNKLGYLINLILFWAICYIVIIIFTKDISFRRFSWLACLQLWIISFLFWFWLLKGWWSQGRLWCRNRSGWNLRFGSLWLWTYFYWIPSPWIIKLVILEILLWGWLYLLVHQRIEILRFVIFIFVLWFIKNFSNLFLLILIKCIINIIVIFIMHINFILFFIFFIQLLFFELLISFLFF